MKKMMSPHRQHQLPVPFSCKVLLLPLLLLLVSCASMDPANVDVQIPESAPEVKATTYTQALRDLGLMTDIFGTGDLKIQSNPIGDNTGTSGSTGGEIPRDITEMIKSSLNSIGGQVTFIPYDPAFIQNQIVTGYSNFDNKLIPDVVISGGITEFDRGLETRGDGTDMGVEAEFTNAPSWVPSKSVSVEYGDRGKTGLARITLDFNLLDFQTMAGIPRMNSVNSMEVSKGMAEKELGITLFGPTFGRKGSIKKVQGRHAAVRLLVEVSMIQVVGKYLNLPYWTLLGDDVLPDPVVMDTLSRDFYSSNKSTQVAKAQEWLFLQGHDVQISGVLDAKTLAALKAFNPSFSTENPVLDFDTFAALFQAVPIAPQTLGRRQLIFQSPVVQPSGVLAESGNQLLPIDQPVSTQYREPESQPAQSQPASSGRTTTGSIGRKLTDEEW